MEEEFKPWLWRAPEGGVIGKRGVRRQDGYEKATGTAIYAKDITRPGMLYAKHLVSPYAHARIKSMDTSQAETYPGVRAVLRYDDPKIEWKHHQWPPTFFTDWPTVSILPDTAHFFPQRIGAIVVADTEQIVDEALRLIKIEWEELPFITNPEEALESGATILRPDLNPDSNLKGESVVEYGDVEAGLEEAQNIIEFKVSKLEEDVWVHAESSSAIAEWKGDNLELWLRHQVPQMEHRSMQEYAPMNKVIIHTPFQGAAFGNIMVSHSAFTARLAVIAAKRTGRPVKMIYDGLPYQGMEEIFGAWNFKIGFNDDGTITAAKIDTTANRSCEMKLREGTKIPNIRCHLTNPYVNRGPATCYKDGAPRCLVVMQVINKVAGELGMDPTEVALINDGCEGISMADMAETKAKQGFDPTRDSLKEILEVGKAAIDWDNKWHAPGTKLLPNGKYHGIGFTEVIGWLHHPQSQPSAGLAMRIDGTVNILTWHADQGQATQTTYSQIVADEIGIRYEDVVYMPFDDHGFISAPPGGSWGLVTNAPLMVRVARKMKQTILELCVEPIYIPGAMGPGGFEPGHMGPSLFPDKTVEDLDIWNSEIFEKANPENKIPLTDAVLKFGTPHMIDAYYGSPLFTWDMLPRLEIEHEYVMVRQCYFMEVEVDPETGKCDVTNAVVVNDVGKVINIDMCNGQQYGGTYMGVGRSNTEAIYYDPQTGIKLNDNHIGYPIALMNDCGPIDCQLVETGLSYSAYGTCGIGESAGATVSTLTVPAIYNAIGLWVDDIPTTPDKVLKALGKA